MIGVYYGSAFDWRHGTYSLDRATSLKYVEEYLIWDINEGHRYEKAKDRAVDRNIELEKI